jgi:hypothetical protein
VAFKHYTLTLNGSAQRLSSVLLPALLNQEPAAVDGGVAADVPLREIILSNVAGNANVIYVGGSSGVSSTSHAFALDPTEASQAPVRLGPYESGPLKLSDFWVIGTNAQLLGIGVVPY